MVRATELSNLILPAGDVRIGPMDYNIYTNAQVPRCEGAQRDSPQDRGREVGLCVRRRPRRGRLLLAVQHRPRGRPEIRLRGRSETGRRYQHHRGGRTESGKPSRPCATFPPQLKTSVVFDQSVFVKQAISTVLREGGIGIFLTGIMILIFLGSFRATVAVFLSIPISVMITFSVLHLMGKSIDAMVLSGLALAFSRLIDDSVVVIENVYRHIEMGEDAARGRRKRGQRSRPGGAGDHAGRRGRVFPGDVPFRRESIPVHRAGAWAW